MTNLTHYGILGMRWGRRGTPSSDHTSASSLRKKHTSELSNADLEKVNKRLQLVKTNKELNGSDVSAGKKFVTDLFVSSSKDIAKAFIVQYGKTGVEAMIAKYKKE